MAMVIVEEQVILIYLIVKELIIEFNVGLCSFLGESAILIIGLHIGNYQNIL